VIEPVVSENRLPIIMNELLQIKNLQVSIKNSKLIDSISFQINKGEIFALVGQSGSGKSLTAYSILNLLKFLGNFNVQGEILLDNVNTLSLSEDELRKIRGNKVGMIFQDPMTSLNPLHTIEKQLSEAMELHGKKSQEEIRARIYELLDMVELDGLKNRIDAYPHQLSGGQRQRVMIAMALANNPKLLIADEPTTALDVTVQKEILALLKKLQKEIGLSILIITHDLTIVKRLADRVAVMNSGKIVELKTTAEIFKNPEHEYTKRLLSAEPKGGPAPVPADAKQLLQVDDLNVSYLVGKNFFGFKKKYFDAVKNISLKLMEGETIGIVGESGSGKSTLAKAILKLIQSQGEITIRGHKVSHLTEQQFKPHRKRIQIVYQDPYSSLNPRMTVKQIISEGLRVHTKTRRKELDGIIDEMLISLGLKPEHKHRYPHELSGGEKQRVGLARSLVLHPNILVLDEPTSALDVITQGEILQILLNFQQKYKIGILFVSHDLRVIRAISHYLLVMKSGIIISEGGKEMIFEKPNETYTRNLIESAFLEGV
jgi:microcin C transport system ATP-binding protein